MFASCDSALASLGTIKDADLSTFAAAYKQYIATTKTALTNYESSYAKKDYTAASNFYSQASAALKTVNTASADADSNIDKHTKEADPNELLMKLQKEISDKLYKQ